MNDALIFKINNKEEPALKELFDNMFHRLHFYSNKITRNWEASEEIVSNVFIKFWNRGKAYVDWAEAQRLLFLYTKNESINFIREPLVKFINTNEFDASKQEDKYDIDYDILKINLIQKINQSLCILSDQCREIILLHKEGYTGKQIASKLSLSESTVYNQYRRAIIQLKGYFILHE